MRERTRVQQQSRQKSALPPAAHEVLKGERSGQPLPEATRAQMEPAFGHDFSGVRVHPTDQPAADLGANALTSGSDIFFAAGAYTPQTAIGQELMAHELTHVVQQQYGSPAALTSAPGDLAEQEATALAQHAAAGQLAPVQHGPTGMVQGDWLDDIGDAVGDAFDMRDNEAELDAWEEYQDSMSDYRDFVTQSHTAENYQSSTDIGLFDAIYEPGSGTLRIVVKCRFAFVNGSAAKYPTAKAEELTWADAESEQWKNNFISTVSSAWSGGNHIFYCEKPWWESLSAKVNVEFQAVDSGEHFAVSVTKIPPGAPPRTSSVTSPTVLPIIGATGPGSAEFDSHDLSLEQKRAGMQTPAIHEAGHMLGLDDEYGESGSPDHSDEVESEFGHGVARKRDGRVMSNGNDIQPEHGITFLLALKEATGMDEWTATMCPVPRPVPNRPAGVPSGLEGAGDFPAPRTDQVPA
jgi:hypothetical protein